MPDVTDTAARKGKPASKNRARRAAETIVYQSRFPPHAFKKEGDETVERFTRIINTAFADALEAKELLEWLFLYQEHDKAWIRLNFGDHTRYAHQIDDVRRFYDSDAARRGKGEGEDG